MSETKTTKLSDPDMQAVPAALARAAKAARELAKKTATSLVVAHNGHVTLVSPDTEQTTGARLP